jgi:hypothetical protein
VGVGGKRLRDYATFDDSDSCPDDSSDDDDGGAGDAAHRAASAELELIRSLAAHKYQPQMEGGTKLGQLTLRGRVKNRRQDFQFAGQLRPRNLADYIPAGGGTFDILQFYTDVKEVFPLTWILVQKMACFTCTEASAECLFSRAGFIMRPERSLLRNKTYERLVLAHVHHNEIFVPVDAVVANFLKRNKEKSWSKQEDEEDERFIVFEQLVDREEEEEEEGEDGNE